MGSARSAPETARNGRIRKTKTEFNPKYQIKNHRHTQGLDQEGHENETLAKPVARLAYVCMNVCMLNVCIKCVFKCMFMVMYVIIAVCLY